MKTRKSLTICLLPALLPALLVPALLATSQAEETGFQKRDVVPGRKYAFIVGINDYHSFPDLRFCDNDARNLEQALVDAGYSQRDIVTIRDGASSRTRLPFRTNILGQLTMLLKITRPNDTVLFSFSGHGIHIDGKSYLCPADARLEAPGESMIAMDDINRLLDSSNAASRIMLLDACRNDPLTPVGARAASRSSGNFQLGPPPKGTLILASCAPDQFSLESEEFQGGVFMHFVIEGLRGLADQNKDGRVSLFEVFAYSEYETKSYVWTECNLVQTPWYRGEGTGVFELGAVPKRSPSRTRPISNSVAKAKPSSSRISPARTDRELPSDSLADARSRSNQHLQLGDSMFKAGKYEAAVTHYTSAINEAENSATLRRARLKRASALIQQSPEKNLAAALADRRAAGESAVPIAVARSTKLRVGAAEQGQLTKGQVVQVSQLKDGWAWVQAVNGNDANRGWVKLEVFQPAPTTTVVAAPAPRPATSAVATHVVAQPRSYSPQPNYVRPNYVQPNYVQPSYQSNTSHSGGGWGHGGGHRWGGGGHRWGGGGGWGRR